MKNFLPFFFLSLFIHASTAQNAPIDFEPTGNGADWTWTTFENDTNPPLEIIPNPDMTGLNVSETVAKFTALQTGAPFAGCESMHGSDIGTFSLDAATSNIKIMVWKPVISDVGIKLVDAGNGSLGEIKVSNTLVNQWEEISFDFSDMQGIVYDQIVIFPDFQARAEDNIVYFDNIVFGEQQPQPMPMTAAPDPTEDADNVISLFSNVYTNVGVDTWLTPWSSGNLTDLQIAGNDTKKYSNLDFVGIETTGNNLLDVTDMEVLHLDIWTPNMTTFRIKLVDFGADGNFGGGDDSEHEIIFDDLTPNSWMELDIPLTDFSGLMSTERIAQLIISGLPVAAGIVYVDNVYFYKDPTSVTDIAAKNFKMMPNPASNQLTITADMPVESVAIYDIIGQLVFQQNNSNQLDITHLPSGSYLVAIRMDGSRFVEKLLISKN